jgi:hypothetical protein
LRLNTREITTTIKMSVCVYVGNEAKKRAEGRREIEDFLCVTEIEIRQDDKEFTSYIEQKRIKSDSAKAKAKEVGICLLLQMPYRSSNKTFHNFFSVNVE